MEPCQHFQDLLLDSLYGLLDAGEEEVLRAHVAVCPECTQAMEEARAQHNLLGRAAQVIRQVPAFVAPQEQPLLTPAEPIPEPAVVLSLPARKRHWKRWLGMSAAAALLLAAGAGWVVYQRGLEQARADFAKARKQLVQIETQFAQLQTTSKEEKEKRIAKAHDKVAHLQVVGPASYQPDSPSPLRISTTDVTGKPLPSQIVTRLLSAQDKELFHSKVSSKGDQTVSLPAGLIATGDRAKLVVETAGGEARATISETIRMQEPALITHLAVNKSVFQVGEVLFFRTLTLERFSLKPVAQEIPLFFSLVNDKGKTVKQMPGETGAGGIGGGELALTTDLPAGEYTLRITQAGPEPRMLPQERKVEILRDLPPQFQFDRAQYFAGETGKATYMSRQGAGSGGFGKPQELEIKSGAGVSLNNAAPGASVKMRTDAKGNAPITFKLPQTLDEEQALLKILVQNGKQKEKLTQAIPVVASRLAVDFFPEGGDLLAGVPNRVYYRIRTPQGDPVNNLQGSVVILGMREPKKVILNVDQKQGLGMFTFTPELNETYRLWVITYPTGLTEIPDPFQKIKIQKRGVALNVPAPVSREGEPLKVIVHQTETQRQLAILATCRGRLVAEEFLKAGKGTNPINLALAGGTRGVVRLTVYDTSASNLTPLAERLIYRIPAEQLSLTVHGLKKTYRKGERVNLRFEATDEEGGKTPAWIGGAVVDERVLVPADLETPAHFFLLSEISRPEDLEQADLLLADSAEGRQALDLFLGTQGWRRFVPAQAASEPELFARDKGGAASQEILFSRENNTPAALAALHDATLKQSLDQLNQETKQKQQALAQEKQQRGADARVAAIELARLQNLPGEILRLGAGFLVLALVLAGVLFLLWGIVRLQRRVSPTIAFVGSFCSFLVCLVLYGAAGSLPGPSASSERMLSQLSGETWPGPENEKQAGKTIPPRSLSSGTFALAPSNSPEKSTKPLSTARRTPSRGLADLAKADPSALAPTPMLQMESQWKDRFNHAKELQEKLTKEGKAKAKSSHPSFSGAKGGGGPDGKKNGKKNMPMGDLAREYPFAYKNPRPSPNAPATLLWHPNLSAPDGSAQVSFDIPQSGATYRIILFGNTPGGRLGAFQGKLQTAK
jgi:hypothetical protein